MNKNSTPLCISVRFPRTIDLTVGILQKLYFENFPTEMTKSFLIKNATGKFWYGPFDHCLKGERKLQWKFLYKRFNFRSSLRY